jgi:WD40-like Beta Propeller Repeat
MIRGGRFGLNAGRAISVFIGAGILLLLGLIGWRVLSLSSMPRRLTDVYVELAPRDVPALAPERPLLAYVSRHGDDWWVHVRELEGGAVVRLRGTEGSRSPFFSWDGRSLAFVSSGILEEASVDPLETEPARERIASVGEIRGASFGADGTIVFASDEGVGLLAFGGTGPKILVRTEDMDGARPRSPRLVGSMGRGAEWVLFDARRHGDASVEAVRIATAERHQVLADAALPCYVDGIGLLFLRGGAIWAARFDPSTARSLGDPIKVVSDVEGGEDAWFDVSRSGALAFRRPPSGRADRRATFGVVGNWLTELRRVLPRH